MLPPCVALIAVVLSTAIFPGVAGWLNDEPILMEMAIRYNRTSSDIYWLPLPFTPCPFGLQGTRGARYGPLPVWIDQILLVFTHNLEAITAIRAILFSTLTALALYWLSRTLGLNPWFATITMLAPWLWFYSRALWDSTWCIPISAGLFSAYAAFLHRPTATALGLTVICGILLPTVHLVGIALALPIAIHLLFFNRRTLWKWKWPIIAIVAACAFIFWPYLDFVFTQTHLTSFEDRSKLIGWLFPLLGGHYLTLGVAGTMIGDGWQDHAPAITLWLVTIARRFSWLALGVVWTGMVLAAPQAGRAIRKPAATAKEHLCLIALATWLCQTVLDGLERLYFSPHYYVGTWIVFIFFAWIAVDRLLHHSPKLRTTTLGLTASWIACVLAGMITIYSTLAHNGGTRGLDFGTCLNNQIEAVKQIQQFSPSSQIDIQFPNWQHFPLEKDVLMELTPPPPGPRPLAHLTIKYRNASPSDARIIVEQSPG